MKKASVVVYVMLIVLIGWALFQYFTKPKTGYVVVTELYNGFELKKDMEKKFLATKNSRQKILDSLLLNIRLMEKRVYGKTKINSSDTLGYRALIEGYYLKKETYDEDNSALIQKYDEQILTQLNQYVKDFGKAYGYTYIFGTGGNGSLMYADESQEEITKKVIEYINQKYKGEK